MNLTISTLLIMKQFVICLIKFCMEYIETHNGGLVDHVTVICIKIIMKSLLAENRWFIYVIYSLGTDM